MPSLEEYYRLLTSAASESKVEWRELLAILTTGESYFFRDKGQFSLLKNLLLPEIIERRQKDRTLRIWSAGCSTGEEPYSIAILIDELLPQLEGWEIVILGTDINEKAIEKARQGIYPQWSFRLTDPELRNRHFRRLPDTWEINEKIRKMVSLRTGNLMEDRFPDRASERHDMDLILCRNVFIYFNSVSVAVVLEKLTETLKDGGYLVTGHGELYGQSLGRLQARMFPESVVYQKASPESGVALERLLLGSSELKEKPKETKIESRIQEPEFSIPDAKKDFAFLTPHSAIEGSSLLPTSDSQLNNYIKTAQECADSGQYDKAADLCRKALEIDTTAVRPYFLLAHISEMKGNNEEIKDLLKRIIYLSPAFIPAWLELGALYARENDAERAKRMRTTALDLLKALPPESVIEPYEAITAGELLEYVKKAIDNT